MKITFVLPDANRLGGTRVIAIYADRLQRRGHEVCVVSTPRRPVALRRRVKRWLNGEGWAHAPSTEPSYLDGLPIEHRILERWRAVTDEDVPDADVVIATWWETAEPVLRLSPAKGAKVYFAQDYGAHAGQPLDRVSETWRYPLYKITISRWLEGLIRGQVDVMEEIALVPNAVDLEQFHAPPRGKQPVCRIGLVYSTRPQKGTALALEAIRMAQRTIPDFRVVMFGHGAAADELPFPEGSTYLPNLDESRLHDVYAQCDAWLFASTLEGFGLPILEAMACRTPVIATPAGAAPELVTPGGGILVSHGDAGSMAAAIIRIGGMEESAWRTMSEAAYRTASAHTWEDATTLFEAALRRARERSRDGVLSR